jgi:serine/threonine protein kinase
MYFKEELTPKIIKSKEGKAIIPNSKPLRLQIQNQSLSEFLSKIFVFKPTERLQPLDALLEPWIVDGLPETIK